MKFTASRLLALISVWYLVAPPAWASTRPRYGGTLRIELQETAVSLDPREWIIGAPQSVASEKLAALVFDRLLALDCFGRYQPLLASEWSHDAALKRWQFNLRPGVKFSDGSALSAADVVAALHPLLPSGLQIAATSSGLTIQSSSPIPDLLEQLASGRFFIYRVQPDGALLGTGAFIFAGPPATPAGAGASSGEKAAVAPRVATATKHLRFSANEQAWSGRPFVNAIDVTLAVPALRQFFDLQLGKTDLVDLSPELVRRATQENLRVWSSAPVALVALRFEDPQPAATDPLLREALALALDRGTMSSVLLQRQAQPASALLPQWLSGYAFLFTMDTNPARAREIRTSLPPSVATVAAPIRLYVDTPGDLPKLIAERVAVNARQANLIIQVIHHSSQRSDPLAVSTQKDAASSVHLFVWRYSSLSPRAELQSIVSANEHGASPELPANSANFEQLFAGERRILDDRAILPLVTLPEFVGLGANVRDWLPSPWGEWHLGDVWMDVPETAAGASEVPAHLQSLPQQPQALVPGANR